MKKENWDKLLWFELGILIGASSIGALWTITIVLHEI